MSQRATDWRREDDDQPAFGRKARQWFARSVKGKLFQAVIGNFGVCLSDLGPLVDWYAERAPDFVGWEDDATYRGKGWSSGAWVIDWAKVLDAIFDAHRETRPQFASLDEWLLDDIGRGASDVPLKVGETGDGAHLTKQERNRLQDAARVRQLHWPRVCSCGAEFRRPPKAKGPVRTRCDSCIGKSKQQAKGRGCAK